MKNGSFFLIIAFGCLVSCQKADTVAPAPDGLYKRWKAENTNQYITFLREGIVLYGADGKEDNCCLYNRFFRADGTRIVFQGVPSKTLPVTLNPISCANVSCYSPTTIPDWQIVSITTDKLVLTGDYYGAGTYIAAP